jgi:cytoskeletal protein RodZ
MGTSDDMVLAQARAPFTARIGEFLRGERATLGRSLLDVQRDLKIRAIYIDAIENTDPSVFPNKSFIPGYVRSYARYLGLDPEQVTAQFRAEAGIEEGGKTRPSARRAAKAGPGVFRPNFPMAERAARGLPLPSFSALGSVLGLAGLLGALGYGGWTVLQNVQRVQFAPVEEAPAALASVERLTAPATPGVEAAALGDLARPVAAAQLAELYRQQELEVPILAPRDGPIAAIDPERMGLLAQVAATPVAPAAPTANVPVSAPPPSVTAPPSGPADVVLASQAGPALPGQETQGVVIVAERAAWIRVYRADKTVIFEKILETGETYAPPVEASPPLIWAGNSGSVYVRVGDQLRGPLGPGTKAVRDLALDPAALAGSLPAVSMAPEVISRAFDTAAPAAPVAVR